MFKIYNLTPVIYPDIKDTKYREIDDFESYEYNNCIAYEFAIRNSEIISELERFEQEFIKLEENNFLLSKDELSVHIHYYRFLILYCAGFDLDSMLYWLFMKRARKLSFFENLKSDALCKEYMKIDNVGEVHVHYKEIQPLKNLFDPLYISHNIVQKLSSSYVKLRNRGICQVAITDNGRVKYDNTDRRWNTNEWEMGWSQKIHVEDIENDIFPAISMTFKRPIIKIINRHEYFSVPLNMKMTKTDLIAYITLLKNEYDTRIDLDISASEKLTQKISKYQFKRVTYLSKKTTSYATISGLHTLDHNRKRVNTIADLFRYGFSRDSNPSKLKKLDQQKVKKLLFLYDYISSANQFNRRLKTAKEHDLNIANTLEQKNDIRTYYKNEKINIKELLDEFYRQGGKRVKNVYRGHTIDKEYRLAKKLIDDKKYKFLI